MEPTPRDAFVSLWTIKQASVAATRHSPDNGVIPFVWSAAIFFGLVGFDILPPLFAAGFLTVLATGTAIWQFFYKKRLPVQPLKLRLNGLMRVWVFYHVCVVVGGTFGGLWLFHGKVPLLFTAIGLLDVAPFLIVGWQMWRRSHRQQGAF